MHSKTKHIRFFTWFFITLFVIVGSGLYFWSQEKYKTRAGTTTSAPEASNTRASTGLASHWTFDREHISGTSITDRVGTNTGTSSGTPAATIGKFGQALDFDASDDHINVTSAASLDIDATEDFSLAGWFNRDTFASDHTIVAKRNGQADTDDGYIVYIDDATDQLIFEVSDTGDTDELSVASTATFTASGWHHFVAVWDQDSATGTEVYIDGVANGTDTGTIANIGDLTEAVAFRIGSESDGGARFDGKLDDIRFYSAALSASDVYQLYTAGMATVNAPVEDPLSQSLLGYWKMDEGTGTSTTADASGNANTLTMTNIDSGDWQAGQIGPFMLDLDGAANPNSEYLTVADPSSGILDFADGASFSITGWFNRDTATSDDAIVAKRVGVAAANTGYAVWIDSGTDVLNFEVTDGTDEYSRASTTASAFTATGWHQFAAVFNNTVGMNIYIDGAANQQTASGTIGNIGSLANAEAFRIGVLSDASTTSPFDGKLDDIRVYGYPLSASDVLKLYQTTAPAQPVDTGLVGHWTFDGPDIQNLTAIDKSGKGNHGTITGATKTIGKLGQGIYSTGVSSYVAIPASSSINNLETATIALWFKDIGASCVGQAIAKDNGGSVALMIIPNGSRRIDFIRKYSGDDLTLQTTTPSYSANTWTHFTVVFSGAESDNGHLYVNGADVTNARYDATGTITSDAGGPIEIGLSSCVMAYDDFRTYNRALSATEVANLYTLGW